MASYRFRILVEGEPLGESSAMADELSAAERMGRRVITSLYPRPASAAVEIESDAGVLLSTIRVPVFQPRQPDRLGR